MSQPDTNTFIENLPVSNTYQQSLCLFRETEESNRHYAQLKGINLAYLEFGKNNATPLIWLHGSTLTAYEIIGVQAGLVEMGYRVIAIDYRGHGKTRGDFDDTNTSLYHIADDVAELMQVLSIDKAVVGGLSKGGWIATAFYDAYPDKVLGLLLEDGGSFSHLRLKEELAQGLHCTSISDFPVEAEKKLFNPSTRYQTQVQGVQQGLALFSPLLKAHNSVAFITLLISLFHQQGDGCWRFHCDNNRLMGEIDRQGNSPDYYSNLPIMQQTQELMLPKVIFRNLHIPLHIIDPVSPSTELPVEQQNKELAAMHPLLITHECYRYEYSPHGAHFQRPERFIASAKMLLNAVQEHHA